MAAVKHANDFKPIDSEGNEVESSHLQLDFIASSSQSKEVVENIHLHSDSSSFEAQSLREVESVHLHSNSSSFEAQSLGEVGSDDLIKDSTPSEAQSVAGEISLNGDAQVVDKYISNSQQYSYDPLVAYAGPSFPLNGDAQVMDNYISNSGPYCYDPLVAYAGPSFSLNGDAQVADNYISNAGQYCYDPLVAYVGLSSSDFNKPIDYNGVTYYSYTAYLQDLRRQLIREMQRDGVAPSSDDVDAPQFSDCMLLATGGSPAIIHRYTGLPWRKGANLCRPYMDVGYCVYGTACIFHHPWPPRWPPTKD